MVKHCSLCKRPRYGDNALCKEHRNEKECVRRAAKRNAAVSQLVTGKRDDEGIYSPLGQLTFSRNGFIGRINQLNAEPLPPDARPTAPAPEPSDAVVPELARVLLIPDVHRPYHDKRAWSTLLRAARYFKPDKIVILGDYADFYSASGFVKDPRRKNDLKWEADDCNVGLDELDALGATHKIFIAGNHEDRLERYLSSAAPSLIGVTSVPELLNLAERGWHYTPYKRSTRLGKLRLTHDTGTAGQNAHRQSVDAFQASVVIGHTHRMEVSYKGNADGKPTVGAMFGWLGDFEQIDYMQAVKARRDWVHGFGIGYQEPNGVIHLQAVPIIEGRCVVAGRLIT